MFVSSLLICQRAFEVASFLLLVPCRSELLPAEFAIGVIAGASGSGKSALLKRWGTNIQVSSCIIGRCALVRGEFVWSAFS